MLAAEAAGRAPLAILLLLWLGLPGLALGGILAASVSSVVVLRWTNRELSMFAAPLRRVPAHTLVARASVCSVGILICLTTHVNSWYFVVLAGCTVGAAALTLLLFTDPNLGGVRFQFRAWLRQRVPVG